MWDVTVTAMPPWMPAANRGALLDRRQFTARLGSALPGIVLAAARLTLHRPIWDPPIMVAYRSLQPPATLHANGRQYSPELRIDIVMPLDGHGDRGEHDSYRPTLLYLVRGAIGKQLQDETLRAQILVAAWTQGNSSGYLIDVDGETVCAW